MADRYDFIIIGTGAGGGTLAHTVAASGKRILLLERGISCRGKWTTGTRGRCSSRESTYPPTPGSTPMASRSNHRSTTSSVAPPSSMARPLYRFRPQDFGDLQHVDGVSPAWPLGYDDFEPYYTKAEWLYQVHGDHGEDPTEGTWSKQYPWPAVSHEPRIQQLHDDLVAGGYHPFHAPCGILLDEAERDRSTCIRCTWCDGYPCLVHAKSDAEVMAVRPALFHPNVTLLTGAEVIRLETDDSGRTVTEGGGFPQREPRGVRGRSDRALRWRRQLGKDPALLGQRPPSQWAGQRLRPGGPQLHVPQQQGDRCDQQGAERHPVSETWPQ